MINNKEIEILNDLINGKEYTFEDIAIKYGISNRSARYYIDNIDIILKKLGYKITEKKKNIIKLSIKQNFQKLYKYLDEIHKLSLEDRILIMKMILFFETKGLNLTELSEKLNISRTTIKKDFHILSKELQEDQIEVLYKNSNGYVLNGDIKKIFIQKISLIGDLFVLTKTKKNSTFINSDVLNVFYEYINLNMINKVEVFLLEIENLMKLNMNEETYGNVFSCIIILIYFIRDDIENHEIISKKFLINTKEYRDIGKIVNSVFGENIKVKEEILIQITDLIMGVSINGFENNTFQEWINGELIIKKMISKASKILKMDLTNDEILYNGLLYHIKPAIYRIKNGIQITNSVFKELILMKDPILNVVDQVVKEIEEVFNFKFPEDEISLIGFHLKSSVDRNTLDKSKKVILVCGLGYGSSKVLEQSLRENYNIDVVDVLPYHLIDNFDFNYQNIDLILSTVNMNKKYDVPIIKINPILKEEDFNVLSKYGVQKSKSKISLKKLINIISESSEIKDKKSMIEKLKSEFEGRIIDDLLDGEMVLEKYLDIHNVKIIDNVKNWKDGIETVGNILSTNHIIENEYVNEMINLIEKHGAYIVIEEGLALPHASISKYVLKTGIALLVVKDKVLFPNDKNVNIFLSFATTDKSDHLQILNDLFELITKHNFIEEVSRINTYKDLRNYFNRIRYR